MYNVWSTDLLCPTSSLLQDHTSHSYQGADDSAWACSTCTCKPVDIHSVKQDNMDTKLYVIAFAAVTVILIASSVSAQISDSPYVSNGSLTFQNRTFYLDGNPLRILSGSLHYFRVVPEYWWDRMRKMKACGLNTLTL